MVKRWERYGTLRSYRDEQRLASRQPKGKGIRYDLYRNSELIHSYQPEERNKLNRDTLYKRLRKRLEVENGDLIKEIVQSKNKIAARFSVQEDKLIKIL